MIPSTYSLGMEKGEKRRALRRKGIANRFFMSASEKI